MDIIALMKTLFLLLIAVLFFSGCSTKEYTHTQTKVIVLKSPQLKFADIGYLRHDGLAVELELFTAGQAVEKISIDDYICVSKGCLSKESFNQEYLHAKYPETILQNILLGRAIFNGVNKQKTEAGFEQFIQDEDVDIIYKVGVSSIYFKDKKNKILVKIKDPK